MNRVANLDGHVGEYGMLVQMEVCFYVSGAWPLILAERALVRNVEHVGGYGIRMRFF